MTTGASNGADFTSSLFPLPGPSIVYYFKFVPLHLIIPSSHTLSHLSGLRASKTQTWLSSSDPHSFLRRQNFRHVLSSCTLDTHSVQAPSTMHHHLASPTQQISKAMHQSQSDPSRSLQRSSNSWTRLFASTMLENWLRLSSTRPKRLQ